VIKRLIEEDADTVPIDAKTAKRYFGENVESLFTQLGAMRACGEDLDWRSGGGLAQPVDVHWTDATRMMTIHMFTVVSHLKRLPNSGSTTFRYSGEQFNVKQILKTSKVEGECNEFMEWLQSPESKTFRVGDSLDGCTMHKGQTCKMFDLHGAIKKLRDNGVEWAQINVGSGYFNNRSKTARACVLVSVMAGMNANGWHYINRKWEQGPSVVNFNEFKDALPALRDLGLRVDSQ